MCFFQPICRNSDHPILNLEMPMENYADTIEYEKYMAEYDYLFEKSYFVKNKGITLSDEFRVSIDEYGTQVEPDQHFIHDIHGEQFQLLDRQGKVIYSDKYIFSRVYYTYIRHSNQNEYFICGENLSNLSIYNITERKLQRLVCSCVIDDDFKDQCAQGYQCFLDWIYNPNNNLLAIKFYFYEVGMTVAICDFSKPDELPLQVKDLNLKIISHYNDGYTQQFRWTEENNLEIQIPEDVSISIKTAQELLQLLHQI